MDWEALAKFFLSTAAIAGALTYIGKRAVDAFFQSRTEVHKSELQRIAAEHSIRFQKLHTERGEVIKDLYAKLALLDDQLYSTLRSLQLVNEPPLTGKVSKLSSQFNDLRVLLTPAHFLHRRCLPAGRRDIGCRERHFLRHHDVPS